MVVTSASVLNCFSAGTVTATAGIPDYVAGFCPYNDVLTEDCYYDHDNAPLDDDYATPKTTAEMKTLSTFSGWNFSSVWKLGAFAGGNRKSITNDDGEYSVPVKDGTVDVFLELDPSGGYPFFQFETKKSITKSGRTGCDLYVRGAMPEIPPQWYGWGENDDGKLGIGSFEENPETLLPVKVSGASWDSLSVYTHLIALKNGYLYASGGNWDGELGFSDNVNRNVLTQVGTDKWKFATAGQWCSFGIKEDGSLWGWGLDEWGKFGLGLEGGRNVFALIDDGDWAFVQSGNQHTLALKSDGTLWGCGNNYYGQLGLGYFSEFLVGVGELTPVIGSHTWSQVSSHRNHVLAIKTDGTLWSWGENWHGQLGIGPTDDIRVHTPTQIGSDTWKCVATGYYFSIGIKSDGTLWGWGQNSNYQLGVELEEDKLETDVPVQIGTSKWKFVTCGWDHTLAIRDDDTVWGWGANWYGQLGLGATEPDEYLPVQLPGAWIEVVAGQNSSFGKK